MKLQYIKYITTLLLGLVQISHSQNKLLFEFGNSLETSRIENLRGCTAIDVSPVNGNIYVGGNTDGISIFNSSNQFLNKFGGYGTGTGLFMAINAIHVSYTGDVYVSDYDRIQVFDSNGNFIRAFGSYGTGNGQFDTPKGINVDQLGNIWVADSKNHRIQKFTNLGVYQSQFGVAGTGNGQFNEPTSLFVLTSTGRIYVSDSKNNRIQTFNLGGVYQSQFGSVGGSNGEFQNVYKIDFFNNKIYAIDGNNNAGNRIQVFSTTGTFLTKIDGQTGLQNYNSVSFLNDFAVQNNIYTLKGGPNPSQIYILSINGDYISTISNKNQEGLSANSFSVVSYDNAGNVYAAGENSGDFDVRVFDANGNFKRKFGGLGNGNGQFRGITDIAVDNIGNIYVLDATRNDVQVFNNNGNFIRKFGDAVSLPYPQSIKININGNLMVGCVNAIKEFNILGSLQRTIIDNTSGNTTLGGVNLGYSSIGPIAVDNSGNIYFYSQSEINSFAKIFKIDNAGNYISHFGNYGTNTGQMFDFYHYSDLEVGVDGKIYLFERGYNNLGSSRIQVFNNSGTYLYKLRESNSYSYNFMTGIPRFAINSNSETILANGDLVKFSPAGTVTGFFGNYDPYTNIQLGRCFGGIISTTSDIVLPSNNRILIFSKNGTFKRQIACVDPSNYVNLIKTKGNNIYRIDQSAPAIFTKYDTNGVILSRFNLTYNQGYVNDFDVDENDNIHTIYHENSNVKSYQCFNNAGLILNGFNFSIGTNTNGQFQSPSFISFLNNKLIIADATNPGYSIQVLNTVGGFLYKFEETFTGGNMLQGPLGLYKSTNNEIVVSDVSGIWRYNEFGVAQDVINAQTANLDPYNFMPYYSAINPQGQIITHDAWSNKAIKVFGSVASSNPIFKNLSSVVGFGSTNNFFSPTLVNTTSAGITITIQNSTTAGAILTIGGITLGKDKNEFSINTAGMLNVVSIGGSTSFSIIFKPTTSGIRNLEISINTNSSFRNPYVFSISATATGVVPVISANPSKAEMGAEIQPQYVNIWKQVKAEDQFGQNFATNSFLSIGTDGWPIAGRTHRLDFFVNDILPKPSNNQIFKLKYKGTASQVTGQFTNQCTISNIQANTPSPGFTTADIVLSSTYTSNAAGFSFEINGKVTDIQIIRPGYSFDDPRLLVDEYVTHTAHWKTLKFTYLNGINTSFDMTWANRTNKNAPIYINQGQLSFIDLGNTPWNSSKTNGMNENATVAQMTAAMGSSSGRQRGISWEDQIDICNYLNKDIWINIPVLVDDNYMIQLANLIKLRLKPSLNVNIEIGNELWNFSGGFVGSRLLTQQISWEFANGTAEQRKIFGGTRCVGCGLSSDYDGGSTNVGAQPSGGTQPPYDTWRRWQARRLKEHAESFATVFGWKENGGEVGTRIRMILAGQVDFGMNGDAWNIASGLEFLKAAYGVDAPSKHVYATAISALSSTIYSSLSSGASANQISAAELSDINQKYATYSNETWGDSLSTGLPWHLGNKIESVFGRSKMYGLKMYSFMGGNEIFSSSYNVFTNLPSYFSNPSSGTNTALNLSNWYSWFGSDCLFMKLGDFQDETGFSISSTLNESSPIRSAYINAASTSPPSLNTSRGNIIGSTTSTILDARKVAGYASYFNTQATNVLMPIQYNVSVSGTYNIVSDTRYDFPMVVRNLADGKYSISLERGLNGTISNDNIYPTICDVFINEKKLASNVTFSGLTFSRNVNSQQFYWTNSVDIDIPYGVHSLRVVPSTPATTLIGTGGVSNPRYSSISLMGYNFVYQGKSTPAQPSLITGNKTVCQTQSNTKYQVENGVDILNYVWQGLPGSATIQQDAGGGYIPLTGATKNAIFVDWKNTPTGNYPITVFGINSVGTSPGRVFTILVTTCGFDVSASSQCTNLGFNFTDNNPTAISWNWNFDLGGSQLVYNTTVAGSKNPSSVSYTTTGIKRITLKTLDISGNESIFENTINVTCTSALIPQTITGFTSIPSQSAATNFYTISGVTGGLSGNTVTFTSSNLTVATISGNVVQLLSAGVTTITANQAGNGGYQAANPVNQIFTITCPARNLLPAISPSYNLGQAVTLPITFNGISGSPVFWSVSGTNNIPPGLIFNTTTGILIGTATGNSIGTYQVSANSKGCGAVQMYGTSIICGFSILPSSTTLTGSLGTPYNLAFSVSGTNGLQPQSWSIFLGSLPTGITLNTATGVISGIPTNTANSQFTLLANYLGSSCNQSQIYPFRISSNVITVTSATISGSNIISTTGGSVALTSTFSPSNANTNTLLGWNTTLNGIASLNTVTGLLTALQNGDGVVAIQSRYTTITSNIVLVTITNNKLNQTITGLPNSIVSIVGFSTNLPSTATSGLALSYVSTSNSIASVSGSVLSFYATGVATITASNLGNLTFNGISQSFVVTVNTNLFPVVSATVSGSNTISTAGGSIVLTSAFSPSNANSNTVLGWSVSNTSIATISGTSGVLTAFTDGIVTVSGCYGGVCARQVVTITNQCLFPNLTQGLVAYYPFDGDANDYSGNGNNGTVTGAILTSDRFGNLDGSYLFNGTNKIESSDNNLPDGNKPRTLSAWFYSQIRQKLFGVGGFYLMSYGVQTLNSSTHLALYGDNIRFATWANPLDFAYLHPLGEWINVTGVFDGTNASIYINGSLKTTADKSAWNTILSGNLTFGPNLDFGKIDDIRIYNRALTVTEVQALYLESSKSVCQGSNFTFAAPTVSGATISWSGPNGYTSASFSNTITGIQLNQAGTYTGIYTKNGCTSAPYLVVVSVSGATAIVAQPISQSICQNASVAISVSATGSNLSYLWNTGATTLGINTSLTGIYQVTVSGLFGTVISNSATISTLLGTSIASISTNETLCGISKTLSVAGLGAGLTYRWSNGNTNASFVASNSGNYTVTVTGQCGNAISNPISVLLQPTTQITTQPQNASFISGNFATVSVSALGSNLSYLWSNGETTSVINTSFSGVYQVTVSGSCGVVVSNEIILTSCTSTQIVTQPISQTVCTGTQANFEVSALGTNLTYKWSNGATTSNILTNSIENYQVTVSGMCGSLVSNSVTLSNIPITQIVTQPQNTTFTAGNLASINVSAIGSNLTYLWNNGNTSNQITTFGVGSFVVTVFGICGNVVSNAIILTSCTSSQIVTQPISQTVCTGTQANFEVSALGTNLTYKWNNGAATSNIVTNSAGNYQVTVSGMCGSLVSNSVTLSNIPSTQIVTQPQNTTFTAGNLASINVSAIGSNLTYLWNNGNTSNQITTFGVGSFVVTVFGICGNVVSNAIILTSCTSSQIVTQPISQTVCTGTQANFEVSALGTNLTYKWNNGAATSNIVTNSAGNYQVTVSGMCGSLVSNSVTLSNITQTLIITQPQNTTFTAGNFASLNVSANGSNLSYLWNNGENTSSINTGLAGIYQVTITGSCGVAVSNQVIITEQFIDLPQTILGLNPISNKTYGDSPIILGNITATSGLPVSVSVVSNPPTNVISFSNNQINILGGGTVTVTAVQLGSPPTYLAANPVSQVFSISKAILTVSGLNAQRKFGEANPNLQYIISGLINNDLFSSIDVAPTASSSAITLSNVGNYPINITGGVDNAYNFLVIPATLSIIRSPNSYEILPNKISLSVGDTIEIGAKSKSNLPFKFALDNSTIATLVGNKIIGKNAGSGLVSVSQAQSLNYDSLAIRTIPVTVSGLPSRSFDIIGSGLVPVGVIMIYSQPSVAGYTYYWSFSGVGMQIISGTENSPNLQVSFSANANPGNLISIVRDANNNIVSNKTLKVSTISSEESEIIKTLPVVDCPAEVTDCKNSYITSVRIGKIKNENTGCSRAGFGDFTINRKIDTLFMGDSYDLQLGSVAQVGKSSFFAVWIDYNNNGKFTDQDDFLAASFENSASFEIKNLVIKNQDSYAGVRRLRVSMRADAAISASDPCAKTGGSGETEDYLVFIRKPDDLEAPSFISPNRDGKNDFFLIRGINPKLPSKLTIMDRFATLIYEKENYKNDWEAKSDDNKNVQDGTYYYFFSNGEKNIKGFVEIRRK